VSVHEEMPREVNRVFVGQLLDLGRGNLYPQGPSGYDGLPVENPSRPPLAPNKPNCWPLNYPKYVKDSNLDAHVIVF
jgi:hypothetical protein